MTGAHRRRLTLGVAGVVALAALVGWLVWSRNLESGVAGEPVIAERASAPHHSGPWAPASPTASHADPSAGCSHPLVPSTVGSSREYRFDSGDQAGSLRLTLQSVERSASGWVHRWQSRFEFAHLEEPLEVTRALACDARGAEAPWGLFALPGIAEIDEVGWLWPRTLSVGARFGGALTLRVMDRPVTSAREHEVVGRETLQVPAGSFDAWRVDFRDDVDGEWVPGRYWVAAGPGLVRSEVELGGGEQTVLELAACEPTDCGSSS